MQRSDRAPFQWFRIGRAPTATGRCAHLYPRVCPPALTALARPRCPRLPARVARACPPALPARVAHPCPLAPVGTRRGPIARVTLYGAARTPTSRTRPLLRALLAPTRCRARCSSHPLVRACGLSPPRDSVVRYAHAACGDAPIGSSAGCRVVTPPRFSTGLVCDVEPVQRWPPHEAGHCG